MLNISIRSLVNRLYIFLTITWPLIAMYIDAKERVLFFLSIIVLFLSITTYKNIKSRQNNTPLILWSILIFYMLVNSLIKGFNAESTRVFLSNNFINPIVFLIAVIEELRCDYKVTLKLICVSLLIYIFYGLLISRSYDHSGRMVTIFGNSLSLHCVSLLFVVYILHLKNIITNKFVLISITLFCIVIPVLTGTRKSLSAELIIIIGLIITKQKYKKKKKHILGLLVLVGILAISLKFLLSSTSIGARFLKTGDDAKELVGSVLIEKYPFLRFLGDRAIQYVKAFLLFLKHPITGIGLLNFQSAAHYHYRLHTEYMVQLCENGIIGFGLLIAYYFSIVKNQWRRLRSNYYFSIMVFAGLFAILFINLTAWTYNAVWSMIIYAIIITACDKENTFYNDEESHIVDARNR